VPDFSKLASLPGKAISVPHCRMVEKTILEKYAPPQFLYTSGRPGRYNLRDTHCLYCSADMPTAAAEYDRYRGSRTTQSLTYWIHADVLVLDLEDRSVLTALGLTEPDLFAPWRALSSPGPSLDPATRRRGRDARSTARHPLSFGRGEGTRICGL
jgi:hypothetical protein